MKKTWYKIYKQICKDISINYPLQQKELKIKGGLNNTIHFIRRDTDEKDQQTKIIDLYFSFIEKYGHKFTCDMNSKFDEKYSDEKYNIDFYTIMSILILSGYNKDNLERIILK